MVIWDLALGKEGRGIVSPTVRAPERRGLGMGCALVSLDGMLIGELLHVCRNVWP